MYFWWQGRQQRDIKVDRAVEWPDSVSGDMGKMYLNPSQSVTDWSDTQMLSFYLVVLVRPSYVEGAKPWGEGSIQRQYVYHRRLESDSHRLVRHRCVSFCHMVLVRPTDVYYFITCFLVSHSRNCLRKKRYLSKLMLTWYVVYDNYTTSILPIQGWTTLRTKTLEFYFQR